MASVLKQDVPPTGERQSFTIEKAGKDSHKRTVLRARIDNGEYRGKRISHVLLGSEIVALEELTGDEFPFKAAWKRKRFSAEVKVDASVKMCVRRDSAGKCTQTEWEEVDPAEPIPKDAVKMAFRYTLSDFDVAEGDSELEDVFQRATKFKRNA